ncbi:MAG: glycoside hydrolase family 15 protein [Rhodospirillales bacterium]|nr:glycoside hydrolase family 15 protein [Rhodospirillales bacterium]MBO6785612.1 glycoside hydrolase family 15 protein [Rhodospirillales bacterium]
MSDLNLIMIGNGSVAALLDRNARYRWACLPDFESDPAFCDLLRAHSGEQPGFFDIMLDGHTHSEQTYLPNTAVVVTTLHDGKGNAVEITDFAPRFKHLGRAFRPTMFVRTIRPVAGRPRIRVRLRPARDWGANGVETTRGSNHIRYLTSGTPMRCTTDIPVSHILKETDFLLDTPANLIFGPDETLGDSVAGVARDFCEKTTDYWREWCRYLSLPFEWQDYVIRAAITLKLCNFEETGAIVAAMTTSIPEAPGNERNWDYRYCWLRDGYFVVSALNRLGATRTMEGYLGYINNIIAGASNGHLQPVYGLSFDSELTEEIVETLDGYRGNGPVRRGNQAYEHIQNDVYGSVILSVTQVFFDKRLKRQGDETLFKFLEPLGEQCLALYNQPDAGLWELRGNAHIHTYSSVLCWAGVDRLARIADHLGLEARAQYWRMEADRVRDETLRESFNEDRNSFADTWGGDAVDASLLLMLELGFVDADDPRFAGTVAAIEQDLKRGDYVFRYVKADDFGEPEKAFVVCTFWYIDALVKLGRRDDARKVFETMLEKLNPAGLMSEHIDVETGELWGNFPQTYSLVGLINSAMELSKTWKEAF